MARRLNVAVIGLGVGEQHIRGWESHPACRVTVLCDTDPAKLTDVATRYPGRRLTTSPWEILDDPSLDAVSIAGFDDTHHAQTLRALANGKHAFVEKPLCFNLDELRSLRSATTRSGCMLSSNLILRMSPRFRELRDRLRAGELGRPFMIEGDYNYGRLQKLTSGWRGQIDLYSVVLGGGIHLVDLFHWLISDRVLEVAAFGTRIATEGTAFRHNDTVVAILRFAGGMVGKLTANFGCVYPHFHRLSVYGTKATFENAIGDALLFRSRDPMQPPDKVTAPYPGAMKGDLIPSFVSAILGEGPAEVATEDVFAVMSICLAIERAQSRGGTVAVEYC